ncbi:MAG: 50S ribosomal protein L28 [Candidatus Firestonebacteria bacterium]|nr:50S ribosomal protein L28 [Candidatus Firestonebacteria bacterium]
MSNVCSVCGKKALVINKVSHANKKCLRKAYPNLRKVKGEKVCAKCLKRKTR